MGNSQTEENPFENAQVAAEWISSIETEKGLTINEINYTMEFRNSIATTGVDIPKKIIDYVVKVGKEHQQK